jgi:uncharacterized protein
VVVLAGVSLAGQTLAPGTLAFSGPSLLGAGIGTAIGLQWMSEHTMRYDIITTLLFGGLRLLLRLAAAHLAGSTNKRRWQSSAQHPG